jgi:hypothetical protein
MVKQFPVNQRAGADIGEPIPWSAKCPDSFHEDCGYLLFVILIKWPFSNTRNAPGILATPLPSGHVKSNVPRLHQESARNPGNSHQPTRSTRIPPGQWQDYMGQ